MKQNEDYEANHERLKDISDEFLLDLFNSIQELYDSISMEIAYRIMKKAKEKWESEEK